MSQNEQVVAVRLRRNTTSTPWGFRMQGGAEYGTPLFIQTVNAKSLSARQGLRVGDRLLAIGDAEAHRMSHEQAKMEIIRSGNELDLIVQRSANQPAIDQTDSRQMARHDAYEEPTEYRGYTNPNVQSRSFKILQESLSYSEANEEGIVLPSGTIPGESIVLKAYNEGKRRLEELAEINPRNFTGAGKSPYRNREPHERMDEELRLQEAMRRREIYPEATVATAKQYEGSPERKPRAQVDLAGSSVLAPAKAQQQYLQQSKEHYQRQSPNAEIQSHLQHEHNRRRSPVPIQNGGYYQQQSTNTESQPQPKPTRPQVAIVHQSQPDQRLLFNVNYNFEDQYAQRRSGQGQVIQANSRQKAVVTPQKTNDYIPRTQIVTSVAADLDLKLQDNVQVVNSKPDHIIQPPRIESPPVKVVETQPAPDKVTVNGEVRTIQAPPPVTLDADVAKLQPGPTVKTPPMTPPPTQTTAPQQTEPAEVSIALEKAKQAEPEAQTIKPQDKPVVDEVKPMQQDATASPQINSTQPQQTISEDTTDGAVITKIQLNETEAVEKVEAVTAPPEQVSISPEVLVAQPQPSTADITRDEVFEPLSESIQPSNTESASNVNQEPVTVQESTQAAEIQQQGQKAVTNAVDASDTTVSVQAESETQTSTQEPAPAVADTKTQEVTPASSDVPQIAQQVVEQQQTETESVTIEQSSAQETISLSAEVKEGTDADATSVTAGESVELVIDSSDQQPVQDQVSLSLQEGNTAATAEVVEDVTTFALTADVQEESSVEANAETAISLDLSGEIDQVTDESEAITLSIVEEPSDSQPQVVSSEKQPSPEKRASPEKKASPVKQTSPEKKISPEKKLFPEKQPSPVKQPSPEKKASSEKQPSPVKQPSPEKKASPEKQPSPVKQPSPEKKASPEKQPSPVKQPSPEKKASPEKQPSPVKQPSPDKKASPEKQPSPVKQPSPEKKVSTEKAAPKEKDASESKSKPTTDRPAKAKFVDSQGGVAARLAKFKQK